jgi:hypothetical protein
MNKYKITTINDEKVHFSTEMGDEYFLCGLSFSSNEVLMSCETDEKINCEGCKEIILIIKKIKLSELSNP